MMNDGAECRCAADSMEYLHAVAVLACVRSGLRYRIERSELSEAFYVRIFRPAGDGAAGDGAAGDGAAGDGEPGHWWGVRVASHLPVYRCSQDDAQVHVPRRVADPDELRDAERALVEHIRSGGRVVADPHEVREALFAAFRDKRDGTERDGPAGSRWRWRERTLRWRLLAVDDAPAAEAPADLRRAIARFAPPDAPAVRLTPREQSAVRHRLNARARWAYEEEAGDGRQPSSRSGGCDDTAG